MTLALLDMMLAEAEGLERQRVRQALHHGVEKAGVTEVIHTVSDSAWQGRWCLRIARLRLLPPISHE